MKKKITIITAVLGLFLISSLGHALTTSEIRELNEATPGTKKVSLGDKLAGQFATTVDQAITDDTSITISNVAYVRKRTGTDDESTALQDGSVGQQLTFALATDGGGDWHITPDTSSGFSDVRLTTAGDNVTLKFVDTTVGWTVVGEIGSVTVTAPLSGAPN